MFAAVTSELSGGLSNVPLKLRGLYNSQVEFYATRFSGTIPAGSVLRSLTEVTGDEEWIATTKNLTLVMDRSASARRKLRPSSSTVRSGT